MKKSGWNVLFMGTDNVATHTLRALHSRLRGSTQYQERPGLATLNRLEILCPPDRKQGRGHRKRPVATKVFALEHQLPCYHTPEIEKSLAKWHLPSHVEPFDIGVVVSFGYRIPRHLLEKCQLGAINMHPSLLPKYRGPAPVHHALLNGDQETGISIIDIDLTAFDVGKIYHQHTHAIDPTIRLNELTTNLAIEGSQAILQVLDHFDTLKPIDQASLNSRPSKAPKLKKQASEIHWHETAEEIYNRWRVFVDTSWGLSTHFQNQKVTFHHLVHPSSNTIPDPIKDQLLHTTPGTFAYDSMNASIVVHCADQTWLQVSAFEMKQKNKKILTAKEFKNGYLHKTGLNCFHLNI